MKKEKPKREKPVIDKYYALCDSYDGDGPKFYELSVASGTCEACRIPGHPELDIFIHGERGQWTISEGKTGMKITESKTKKGAIEFVIDQIKRCDREGTSIEGIIEKHVKKYGLSPRWTGEKVPFEQVRVLW